MLFANKISCIRYSISFICCFLFTRCIFYKALDLNLDFSKFKLITFKFSKVGLCIKHDLKVNLTMLR